jgi:hypothetical protein
MTGRSSALLACLFVTACATPHPIYKRWAAQAGLPAYTPPQLSVSSTPAAASPGTSKFKVLSDREGAAYINAVAASQKKSDVPKTLAAIFHNESGSPDYTDLPRTLVVTIDRDNLRPADRLYQTKVTILADGFEFGDYDPTATQITSIDVESMEAKQGVTSSAELGPNFGGVLGAGKFSIGTDNSRDETAKLQENTVTNVQVYPGKVTIYRRGAVNVDLIGNTLVKLSAKVRPTRVVFKAIASNLSLSGDDGKDLPPAKASMDISMVHFSPPEPLTVCAHVEYLDRDVSDQTQNYYDESQHSVSLIKADSGWERYILVPADEASPPTWQIIDSSQEGLAIDSQSGIHTINFSSFDDVETFLNWITRKKARVVGRAKLFTHGMNGLAVPFSGNSRDLRIIPDVGQPKAILPCDKTAADAAVHRAEFQWVSLGQDR